MVKYVLRRLFTLVFTLFGISLLTFAISHIVPGDPAALAAGPTATEESIAALRAEMDLDQPLLVQYGRYMSDLVKLDLGRSIITRRPVKEDLLRFFPATLELILSAFFLYLAVGIPLGVISALTRGRWLDLSVRLLSIIGYATPLFVIALWLQYGFYYKLDWFPSGGRLPILAQPPARVTGLYLVDSLLAGDLELFGAAIRHLALPVTALALSLMAIASRFTRASMLNELDKDYITMARLKGLMPFKVVVNHALRNSLIPVVTMTGIQFGYFIGGSVLVEIVYLWPGLGTYAFESTVNLDYAPVMGVTLLTSFIFVMTNLAIDLLYPLLDPRVTLAGER